MSGIPVFARLKENGNQYRMPSGRIAVLVNAEQLESRSPTVTLRYLDDGEELSFSKTWFNLNAVPA